MPCAQRSQTALVLSGARPAFSCERRQHRAWLVGLCLKLFHMFLGRRPFLTTRPARSGRPCARLAPHFSRPLAGCAYMCQPWAKLTTTSTCTSSRAMRKGQLAGLSSAHRLQRWKDAPLSTLLVIMKLPLPSRMHSLECVSTELDRNSQFDTAVSGAYACALVHHFYEFATQSLCLFKLERTVVCFHPTTLNCISYAWAIPAPAVAALLLLISTPMAQVTSWRNAAQALVGTTASLRIVPARPAPVEAPGKTTPAFMRDERDLRKL